jgi:hypothetical protein
METSSLAGVSAFWMLKNANDYWFYCWDGVPFYKDGVPIWRDGVPVKRDGVPVYPISTSRFLIA